MRTSNFLFYIFFLCFSVYWLSTRSTDSEAALTLRKKNPSENTVHIAKSFHCSPHIAMWLADPRRGFPGQSDWLWNLWATKSLYASREHSKKRNVWTCPGTAWWYWFGAGYAPSLTRSSPQAHAQGSSDWQPQIDDVLVHSRRKPPRHISEFDLWSRSNTFAAKRWVLPNGSGSNPPTKYKIVRGVDNLIRAKAGIRWYREPWTPADQHLKRSATPASQLVQPGNPVMVNTYLLVLEKPPVLPRNPFSFVPLWASACWCRGAWPAWLVIICVKLGLSMHHDEAVAGSWRVVQRDTKCVACSRGMKDRNPPYSLHERVDSRFEIETK